MTRKQAPSYFRKFLFPSVTLLGLIYLILVVFGEVDPEDRRLKTTDIGILVVILLINSDLIDRLAKLRVGSEGMTLKLDQLDEKQNELSHIQNTQKEEIKDLAGLLIRDLLSDQERNLLIKLASDQAFTYENKSRFVEGLTSLHERELIESPDQDELKIEDIPHGSNDLRQFVQVSDLGYVALKFMQKTFSDVELDRLDRELSA
jgi:hypothetical protein